MEDLVIVGGGIAGLSCLNHFLDKNISPLLLESGTAGSPKMCGEFVAAPAVHLLNQWDIKPAVTIRHIHFFGMQTQLKLALEHPAGALPRSEAEIALAARAVALGGRLQEHTAIQKVLPGDKNQLHQIYLASGEMIEAKQVIMATGRFFNPQHSAQVYLGFKGYIPCVIQPETLCMFGFKGGYFGVIPINDHSSNLTCIIKKTQLQSYGSLYNLLKKCLPMLSSVDLAQIKWLEGTAPAFGFKPIPLSHQMYCIGDALVSLPPAIGYGFANSLISAQQVVEHVLNVSEEYAVLMQKQLKKKLYLSYVLHALFQNPIGCKASAMGLKLNPWISRWMLNLLGY